MGGLGCPVRILQKRLWILEIHFENETLASEDHPSYSLLWSEYLPHSAADAPRLQVLQAQLIQVHNRQKHLLQQVDNFTKNQGLAPLPRIGAPQRRMGERELLVQGQGDLWAQISFLGKGGLPKPWPSMGPWGQDTGHEPCGVGMKLHVPWVPQIGLCPSQGGSGEGSVGCMHSCVCDFKSQELEQRAQGQV